MNCPLSSRHPLSTTALATANSAWARKPLMPRARLVVVAIFSSVTCTPSGMTTDKPFILTDRASLGFDQIYGGAEFICTSVQNSLIVSNEGLDDLKISDITYTGSGAF